MEITEQYGKFFDGLLRQMQEDSSRLTDLRGEHVYERSAGEPVYRGIVMRVNSETGLLKVRKETRGKWDTMPAFAAFNTMNGYHDVLSAPPDAIAFRPSHDDIAGIVARNDPDIERIIADVVRHEPIGTKYWDVRKLTRRIYNAFPHTLPETQDEEKTFPVGHVMTHAYISCPQLALLELVVLGMHGIKSELVIAAEHVHLRANVDGTEFVIDPTWDAMFPESELRSKKRSPKLDPRDYEKDYSPCYLDAPYPWTEEVEGVKFKSIN